MSCLAEWNEEGEGGERDHNTEFSAYIKSDGKSYNSFMQMSANLLSYSLYLSLYMMFKKEFSLAKASSRKNPQI